MTASDSGSPSVAERTRPVAAGAPVIATHFLGDTAVLVLAEEALLVSRRRAASGASMSMAAASCVRPRTASGS